MPELRSRSDTDLALVAAFRSGDERAFDAIYDRHRGELERHAKRVLGRRSDQADDVVQEAMIRASRALRRDERHIELRPWLHRLVRNCALDELSRVRTDRVPLEDAETAGALRAPETLEPEQVSERRDRMRDLLGDLADLPTAQRHALLRRELDGVSHAALAAELEVTEQASKMLVHRARTNLVRMRDARDTGCATVRGNLLGAHDEGRRASAATYRHLAGCADCRAFRAGLKDARRAAALLVPAPPVLGIALSVAGKLGVLGAKAGTIKTGAAVATGAAVTAGAVGIGLEVFEAGDPAPPTAQRQSPALPDAGLAEGRPVPRGNAVVRRTVPVRGGAMTVTLPCPPGMRVADLLDTGGTSAVLAPRTVVGRSTMAEVRVEPRLGATRVRLTLLCRRPDAAGSIVTEGTGARAATADTRRIGVRREALRVRPGAGAPVGSVRLGQPVRPLGRPRAGWRRIVTDTGASGWVRESVLRPVP